MKKRTGRWGSLALICVMVMMLCACSTSGGEESKEQNKQDKEESGEKNEKKKQMPSIEEQVLYEENGFRITATSLEITEVSENDGYSFADLNLMIENEGTEDMGYVIQSQVVNKYEMDGSLIPVEKTVPAGKKANEKLTISGREMEKAGFAINEIGEIEVDFIIGKAGEGLSDSIRTGLMPVRTSEYDKIESKPAEGGKEIYNEAGVRIVYLGMVKGEEEGQDPFSADVYIENTSDTTVVCWITGGTIDGTEVSSYNTPHVSAGRMARTSIGFFGDEAEKIDVETINEVTVTIHLTEDVMDLSDPENYSRDITDSKDVTFTVK